MKFSKAMLKGFQQVGGKQCKKELYSGGTVDKPLAVCANGAALLGMHGMADWDYSLGWSASGSVDNAVIEANEKFLDEYGMHPVDLNDEGMPWEHIYGMAVAAGL